MYSHRSIFNVCPRLKYSRIPNLFMVLFLIITVPFTIIIYSLLYALEISLYKVPNLCCRPERKRSKAFCLAFSILLVLPLMMAIALIIAPILVVFGTLPI